MATEPSPLSPAPRRLAAVLATEFAGYARRKLGGEAAAVGLAEDLAKLTRAEVAAAGGAELNLNPEGVLAEFPSAGAAVTCARTLLQRLAERNAKLPSQQRVEIRAAVHADEFATDAKGGLTGESVRIAEHVLTLADPGGLALTFPVWEELRRQVPLRGRLLAPRHIRDLPRGVKVFVVPPASARYLAWTIRRGGWKSPVAGLAAAAVALALAWRFLPRPAPGEAAPARETLRLLNGFESGDGCYPYSGMGGTLAWSVDPGGFKGKALRLEYTQKDATSFWGLHVNVDQDWSRFSGLRFMARSASGTRLRLELTDREDQLWIMELAPPTTWTAVDVPFSRFEARADFNPKRHPGPVELDRIKGIDFIQLPGTASDTLWVDELSLVGTE